MRDPYSCPCKSGKHYQDCCKRFHEGELPRRAVELMRSRYSAYALGLIDYIIATTHPDNPLYEQNLKAWKEELDTFSRQTTFHDLKILSEKEEQNKAEVTFAAILKVHGNDASFVEVSTFKKEKGKWLYLSGKMDHNLLSSLHLSH